MLQDELLSLCADYIREVSKDVSEAQKRDLFTDLLRNIYGRLQDIRIEDSVSFKGVYTGRVDLAVEGVLLEFKKDITTRSARKKALEELRKYLRSDQYGGSPFGIITDGIRFEVYERENLKTPVDTFSFPQNEEDIKSIKQALYRLDRYLLAPFRVELTSERVIDIFGYNSTLFRNIHRKLLELYRQVREDRNIHLRFSEWQLYMSFVYGRDLEKDLFFRHTYLSVLVKILALNLLKLGKSTTAEEVLSGELFERAGIKNYIEKDFYSWILHPQIRDEINQIADTISEVFSSKFELKDLKDELEEDILKELYQNIVTREERHLLGEYYTPDWLVQEVLEEVMTDPNLKVLDPSCGSGSFLFFAIKKKKEQFFESSQKKLEHILDTVVGIDINPLAVLIAKTNYLLALGELLKEREKDIYIPVYSADSLLAFLEDSQRQLFGNVIKINLNDSVVELPRHEDTELIDRFIDIVVEYALEVSEGKDINFYTFLSRNYPEEEDRLRELERGTKLLSEFAKDVEALVSEKGDSIWSFVFKNIYKPLFLSESFDLVVGNPPWLAFNRMHRGLQRFVEEFLENNGISVEGHVKSHIDIAFVFLIICFVNYLKRGGKIAFVLPYSLISGDQNAWLRKRQRYGGYTLDILKVYDLKGVQPLFNVPSCVLVGKKATAHGKPKREIPALLFRGKLPRHNTDLPQARKSLTKEEKTLYYVQSGRKNYWTYNPSAFKEGIYAQEFREGATIVPRSFWFVERVESSLGYSKESVPIVSRDTGDEKLKAHIRGSAPERFFFRTILSKRMYPFGWVSSEEIVLPLEVISSSDEAVEDIEEGFRKARELMREFREGIDETADGDACAILLNTGALAGKYLESEEVSTSAKRKILKIIEENRDLIEELGLEGAFENLHAKETQELRERFRYRLLDYENTSAEGSATERFYRWIETSTRLPRNFKEWLIRCQKTWEEWRGEKAKSHNIIDWLNYRNKLTSQPVKGGYLVLYTAGGSNPCACVVENDERFVVDHMTFYSWFHREDEALYVASFINSPVLHKRIREQQSQGLFGERHIHKLIVQQPIPKFDPENELHRELVRSAKSAREKALREEVKKHLSEVHTNRIRSEGRYILEFELNHIDRLVARLLGEEEPPPAESLCIFLDADTEEKELRKFIRRLLKEKNIDTEFRLVPPRIAYVRYNPLDINPEDFKLSIDFLKNIGDVYEALIHSYILLKAGSIGLRKLVSVFRRGNSKEIKDYKLPL